MLELSTLLPGLSATPSPSDCLPVPGSSAHPSPSLSDVRVPGSSALSISGALVPWSYALPSPSGCLLMPGIRMLESFVPSLSDYLLVLRLSAPSTFGVHMPRSFPPRLFPLFLIWSSLQTPTPILGK